MIPKLIDDLTELAGALVLLENFAKENGSIITKNPLVTHVNAEELPDPKQSRFSHLSTSETGEERLPILPELAKILKIPFAALPLWTQSINASSMLKSSMKKSLGSDQTLFECRGGGTKISIAVVRAKDGKLCIFSNYNGFGKRPSSYCLIRPEKTIQEPFLWQV